MSECPQLEQCPIWKSFEGPIKTAWINSYCRGPLQERCARMQRLQEGKPISPRLLPNGTLLSA